jgi:DNA-binding protein HU-beta
MNKAELVAAVADKAGVTQKQAGDVLDAFLDVAADVVSKDGGKLALPGWLTIEQKRSAARQARNPQTGAIIDIPEKNTVKISAGSKLKAAAAG